MSPALPALVLSLSLAAATAALAQPAAPAAANFVVPHAFAGYSQPDITECTTTGDTKRECVVPAMTAGRYLIVAQDGATSTGAGSTQTLEIALNGVSCVALKSQPFTGQKGMAPVCQVTFLTDAPVTVTALFSAEHATPNPGGPRLVFRRVPWNGIMEARGGQLEPRQQPATAK